MAAKKKPTSKTPPKATGKAVSASGVRKMERSNIKDYDAMLDSAGDILDYPKGDKLHKQAAALLNKYNYAAKKKTQVAVGKNLKTRVGDGMSPYSGVPQKTANALSRDYNILMKAVTADKKAYAKKTSTRGSTKKK